MTPEVLAPDIASQIGQTLRRNGGEQTSAIYTTGVKPSHHGHPQLPPPNPEHRDSPAGPPGQAFPAGHPVPVRPRRGRRPHQAQRPGDGRPPPAPHGQHVGLRCQLATPAAPLHSRVDAEKLKASQLLEDSDLEPPEPKSKLRLSHEENRPAKGKTELLRSRGFRDSPGQTAL